MGKRSSTVSAAFGTAATLCLFAAVWLPATPPDWLARVLHLSGGDPDAAAPWLRWLFVTVALLLVVLPRIWTRPIWVEVLVATLVTVGVYAGVKQYRQAQMKTEPGTPIAKQTVGVTLPKSETTVLAAVLKDKPIVILVVRPQKVVGQRVIYTTARYEATATLSLTVGDVTADVDVDVERGVVGRDRGHAPRRPPGGESDLPAQRVGRSSMIPA